MLLRVQVHVPLSGGEVLGLLRCERSLPGDGTFRRAPLLGEPDLHTSVLALARGSMEMGHGDWSRQSAVVDRPADYAGRRIVGDVGHPLTGALDRGHRLAPAERHLKGLVRGQRELCPKHCADHTEWNQDPWRYAHHFLLQP